MITRYRIGSTDAGSGSARPVDHGLVAWSFDPVLAVVSSALTGGTVYLTKLQIHASVVITKIYWNVATAGVTPTAGQNEVGLYDSAGTRLAVTNVDSVIGSTGLKTTTITSQTLAANGFCWVAMVFNAVTIPAISRGSAAVNSAVLNVGLSAATARYATGSTAQTSLVASVTPSSFALSVLPLWVAVGV